MMNYYIDIQKATDEVLPLDNKELTRFASLALRDFKEHTELTIRLVTLEEITQLNNTYRKQNKATNVLAFPCSLPPEVQLEYPLLGDVIICPQIVFQESKQLKKNLESHWALMVIHGILHLLGYDHINDEDAAIMQSIEINLLAELGFDDPYLVEGN